ncbi:hypothetical protein M378DRAFT_162748 [Amanita muscaria Koide BX008]|uniref:Uncharacterized protein n=1 Tax=Amanita muscaria (strain Koide BX008) TaxID=946122 RepID=A0A0C2SNQ7_AMAMK|nr:hypothetical protein M378DRAFT_162748 [Amanita muscaria Koide BX008]
MTHQHANDIDKSIIPNNPEPIQNEKHGFLSSNGDPCRPDPPDMTTGTQRTLTTALSFAD